LARSEALEVTKVADTLGDFVKYSKLLKGDEKGEAQVFCDRLFIAFGHKGYKEAGADLEFRIKKLSTKGTSFADLVWKPRLLLEMKKRGEKLGLHFKQAFDYWIHAVPDRPRYVVLCNFDELWIYDFDKQIDEPVDVLQVKDIPQRYAALNFLFPDDPPPIFGNDREEVSRAAADKVAAIFNSLVARGIDRQVAQRFSFRPSWRCLPRTSTSCRPVWFMGSRTPASKRERVPTTCWAAYSTR
jgi:hypothetical protein